MNEKGGGCSHLKFMSMSKFCVRPKDIGIFRDELCSLMSRIPNNSYAVHKFRMHNGTMQGSDIVLWMIVNVW